jgi:F0F1-type ATP synthase membrane subunit b/b'
MSTGTDKMNAANFMRREVHRLEAFLKIADDLQKLGSVENAVGETEARLSGLERLEAEAKERIAAAGDEAANIIAKANTHADAIRAAAQKEADRAAELVTQGQEALSKAKAQAAELIADARKERDRIAAEIRAELGARVDKVLTSSNGAHA